MEEMKLNNERFREEDEDEFEEEEEDNQEGREEVCSFSQKSFMLISSNKTWNDIRYFICTFVIGQFGCWYGQ